MNSEAKHPQPITGRESDEAVMQNAAAMWNSVFRVGDVVLYRSATGALIEGYQITSGARVENGQAVCNLTGFDDPVRCDRVRPLTLKL